MRAKKQLGTLKGKDRSKLVFVGGNYDHMPPLRMIEKYAKQAGFKPVIPWDYKVDQEDIHDADIHILSKCGNAIFEVTSSAGQLMELERCSDNKILPIIVCAIRERPEEMSKNSIPDSISTMIKTMKYVTPDGKRNYEIDGYQTFEKLKQIIHKRLKKVKTKEVFTIGNAKITQKQ